MNQGDLVAGRYRLLRPIGAGAMGTVWAARHELLGRDFAIKLATLSTRAGPEVRARFLREAQIVGKLRHPNVVDVADVGDLGAGAGLYLAMELLEGQSLAERIEEHGAFDPPEALAIVSEVCRGLTAAHLAGVVHRDVKPANIFLARGPTGGIVPKLLDFGISKGGEKGEALITVSGQLFGTPAYMSPEQALGETDVDHRTDIWSLGVVLYEMLTRRRPFAAQSYPALLPLIAEKDPTPLPPEIPEDVHAIIMRCLAKSREDRYPSADALREAIDVARGVGKSPSIRPNKIERHRTLPSLRPRAFIAAPDRSRLMLIAGGVVLSVTIAVIVARLQARRGHATVAPASTASALAASADPTASVVKLPVPEPASASSTSASPSATGATRATEATEPSARVAPSSAEPVETVRVTSSSPAPSTSAKTRARPGARTVTKVNSAGF